LLGDAVAVASSVLGRVHEINPRDNFRRFDARQNVETVAIVPAVWLPGAAVDALPRLCCPCLFRRWCRLRCFGWRFLGFDGSQFGQCRRCWRCRWRCGSGRLGDPERSGSYRQSEDEEQEAAHDDIGGQRGRGAKAGATKKRGWTSPGKLGRLPGPAFPRGAGGLGFGESL
jgi:hypothetical protein